MVPCGEATGQTLTGFLGNNFQQSCDFKYHLEEAFCQLLIQSQTPTPVNDLVVISPIRISTVTRAGLKGCPVTALSAGSFTFWAQGFSSCQRFVFTLSYGSRWKGSFISLPSQHLTSLLTRGCHNTTLSSSFLRNIKVAGWKHTIIILAFLLLLALLQLQLGSCRGITNWLKRIWLQYLLQQFNFQGSAQINFHILL